MTRGDNEALFAAGDEISYLGNLRSFWELSRSTYLELGATGVYGENDGESLRSRVLGLSLAARWTPPGRALYRDFSLKGEWYFVDQDVAGEQRAADGGYVQASLRLSRRWILGARADFLKPAGADPDILQLVPSLTFWQSEWVRLRLQYNYLRPEGGDANHTSLTAKRVGDRAA